jgi:hydroxymethylpyrimidine pyrophosphatase-like HAD family hydrolase
MLTWASHGVAMANAHIDVKIVANEITVSNDEDGVAEILERELG